MYIYIYHCIIFTLYHCIIFTLSLDLLSWLPSPLHDCTELMCKVKDCNFQLVCKNSQDVSDVFSAQSAQSAPKFPYFQRLPTCSTEDPALAGPCEPWPWTRRSHPAGEQSSNEMDLGTDRNK